MVTLEPARVDHFRCPHGFAPWADIPGHRWSYSIFPRTALERLVPHRVLSRCRSVASRCRRSDAGIESPSGAPGAWPGGRQHHTSVPR